MDSTEQNSILVIRIHPASTNVLLARFLAGDVWGGVRARTCFLVEIEWEYIIIGYDDSLDKNLKNVRVNILFNNHLATNNMKENPLVYEAVKSHEEHLKQMNAYMTGKFMVGGVEDENFPKEWKPTFYNQNTIDYEKIADKEVGDIHKLILENIENPSKIVDNLNKIRQKHFGLYFLNSETQNLSFEKMEIKVIDPNEEKDESGQVFADQLCWKFFKHVQKKYLSTGSFYAPSLEYERWLSTLSIEDIPKELTKDSTKSFQLMGPFGGPGGGALVPVIYFNAQKKLVRIFDFLNQDQKLSPSRPVILLNK